MAISSPGIGSGIDVNAIVDKLVSIERQPIVRLQTQEAKVDAKLSAFGKLKSALSTLQDAARALSEARTWQASRATSADAAAVEATATGAAPAGSYGVLVDRLAQRQATATGLLAPSATFAAGTLTIERGDVDGFDPAGPPAGSPTVAIVAGDTLAQVRDRINAAGAGVTASIVNDTGGARLVLRSADTGAANAFRVAAQDAAGAAAGATLLSALAVDPSAPPVAGASEVKQPAADARLVVDGLPIDSAGNRVEGVIEGVTLDLRRRGTEPVEIQVASDGEALTGAIKKFTDAFNALNALLAEQTRYDPATRIGGPLQGDINATTILGRLRGALADAIAGAPAGAFSRLSDIGITLQRDGSLATDSTRLQAALATPDKLRALFAASDADPARAGLGRRFADLAFGMLGSEGVIATATDSLGRIKRDLDGRQELLERRVQGVQARLLKQYTDLDTKLSQVTTIDWSKLYVDYSGK